jgi:hypothetical protein
MAKHLNCMTICGSTVVEHSFYHPKIMVLVLALLVATEERKWQKGGKCMTICGSTEVRHSSHQERGFDFSCRCWH